MWVETQSLAEPAYLYRGLDLPHHAGACAPYDPHGYSQSAAVVRLLSVSAQCSEYFDSFRQGHGCARVFGLTTFY